MPPYAELLPEDLLKRLYSDGPVPKSECQYLRSFDCKVDRANLSIGVGVIFSSRELPGIGWIS